MKENEKKLILILFIVLIIAIIIFGLNKKENKDKIENKNIEIQNNITEEFVQVLEDGTKLNTSSKLKETKQIGVYKFENIQLTEQDGQSVLLADVTNISQSETRAKLVDVILLDKDGNEIVKLEGGIISPLEPGGKTQFNSSMTFDFANAYDLEIKLR